MSGLKLDTLEERIDIVLNSDNDNKNCFGTALYLVGLLDVDSEIKDISLQSFEKLFPNLKKYDEPQYGSLILYTLSGENLKQHIYLNSLEDIKIDLTISQICHIGVVLTDVEELIMGSREGLHSPFRYADLESNLYDGEFDFKGYWR